MSVLAAGRHQAARDAIDADTPPTGSQHKQLALYLFDAYAHAVAPATAIDKLRLRHNAISTASNPDNPAAIVDAVQHLLPADTGDH